MIRHAAMAESSRQEIKLFYCYAHEDKALRDELQIHLSGLRRQYQLTNWHDREILPGENWEQVIDTNLNSADIILLLISPHFMDSEYCYGKEMTKALEREKVGICRVIPILLRPTDWEDAPFSYLQMLPTDARPITSWTNRDSAFLDVAREIRKAIKDFLATLKTKTQKTAYEYVNEGELYYKAKHYKEALAAYNFALALNANDPYIFGGRAKIYLKLGEFERVLEDLNHAFELDPKSATAWAYTTRGRAYKSMNQDQKALDDFNRAYRLAPTSHFVEKLRNETMEKLKEQQEKF